jgi:hypothetical protein
LPSGHCRRQTAMHLIAELPSATSSIVLTCSNLVFWWTSQEINCALSKTIKYICNKTQNNCQTLNLLVGFSEILLKII